MSDVMHYNTCIPAATPLWNSGHAVTSAAAPGTALAADRSKLKTALCCWGRRPARHRSGMHNGSVGMGRNVPAKTHSIQRVFCPTQCSTAWSRRSDRHRSGMHQGSVGMGRNVPAHTHSIQAGILPHTVLDCMEQAIRQTQIWYAPRLCGYGTQCACTDSHHSGGSVGM